MKKSTKILIAVLIIIVGGIGIFAANPELFQGFLNYRVKAPARPTQTTEPRLNLNISKNTQLPPVEINVTVKDSAGKPVSKAEVNLGYERTDNNGNTYRYGTVVTKLTFIDGKVQFSEEEFLKNIDPIIAASSIKKPYKFFLSIYRNGYIDRFFYPAKEINGGAWNQTMYLTEIGQLISKKSGPIEAKYYPGQEACGNLGLEKLNFYYPKVKELLGVDLASTTKNQIQFNLSAIQGFGDWTGSANGIETRCLPWTPDLTIPSVVSMWNHVVPHEYAHVFIAEINVPYWSNEGLAEFVNFTINKEPITCDSSKFITVQNLAAENIADYHTALCFWKLLEDKNPGIVKKSVIKMKSFPAGSYAFNQTKDLLAKIIVPVLVQNYGYTQATAEKYISDFMVQFKYDPSGF